VKISIDGKDFYTDDFNEEQLAIANAIQVNTQHINHLTYQLECVRFYGNQLGNKLSGLLASVKETPEKKPVAKKGKK